MIPYLIKFDLFGFSSFLLSKRAFFLSYSKIEDMKLKMTILILAIFTKSTFAACTIKSKSYLRNGPSTRTTIVRTLPRYSPLVILEKDNEWVHVKTKEAEGWIFHTLISENMNCMILKSPNAAKCPSDDSIKHELSHNEGLKVLRMEIGCNFVQDKWGRKFWVNSFGAWPTEMKKLIAF